MRENIFAPFLKGWKAKRAAICRIMDSSELEMEEERWCILVKKLYCQYPWWHREVDHYVHEVLPMSSWRVLAMEEITHHLSRVEMEDIEKDEDRVILDLGSVVQEAVHLGLFEPTICAAARTSNLILLDSLIAHQGLMWERLSTSYVFIWERHLQHPWLLAAYLCCREGHLSLVQRCLPFVQMCPPYFNNTNHFDPDVPFLYHDAQLAYKVWKFIMVSSSPFENEENLHDIVKRTGLTMVHIAAANGDEKSMKRLLVSHQAKASDFRLTPLHLAACNGHENIVRLLLEQESKGEVNARENFLGRSPLHFAAEHGHLSIVGLLISCVHVDVDGVDNQGVTPLHLATTRGHTQIVQLLLSTKKCNINQRATSTYRHYNNISISVLNSAPALLLLKHALIPALSLEGFTALHFAAANGHVDVVKLIMEQQTSVSNNDMGAQVIADLTIWDWVELAKDVQRIGDNKEKHTYPLSMLLKRAREEQQFDKIMHKLYRALWDEEYELSLALGGVLVLQEDNSDYMQQQLWELLMLTVMQEGLLKWTTFEREKLALTLVRRKIVFEKSKLQHLFREALLAKMPTLAMELLKEDYHCDLVGETDVVWGSTLLAYASNTAPWVRRDMPQVPAMMESRQDVRKQLYEDRQVYVEYANTLLVGAVLIAGLAFQGWLQPPRGFDKSSNKVVTEPRGAMQAFVVSTILGFSTAMGTVLAGANGAMPLRSGQLAMAKEKAHRAVVVASILLAVSVACVTTSFFAAAIAVLPSPPDRLIIITLSLCALLLFISCYWFLQHVESLTGTQMLARLFSPRVRLVLSMGLFCLGILHYILFIICYPILLMAYRSTHYCCTRPCIQTTVQSIQHTLRNFPFALRNIRFGILCRMERAEADFFAPYMGQLPDHVVRSLCVK